MLAHSTAAGDWIVILPVILPLMGAALLLMLRRVGIYHAGFAILVVLAVLASNLQLLARVTATGPVSMTMGRWLPPFGISFTADATGALFALAAAFVTLIVLIYAAADPTKADSPDSFPPLVLLLLAGVSGSFLTGDLFNLYVWFEVMLIASFGLLILGGRNIELDGAIKYGFLNYIATTLFLMALGLLYGLVGTLNMADIIGAAANASLPALTAIAALLFLAFGIKAAAFPVNAWLPASYHVPASAISALLAGLLTKVGVYALVRTLVALVPAGRDALHPAIAAVAIFTLLLAPLGAIAETNLRRALGFLVMGGIGATIAGVALAVPYAIAGSVVYVFHAMLTLSALYLVAGLIEKLTGTTDTRAMGGLYAASAPISVLFLVLVFAVSGVPPFLGFWPKLLLLQGGVELALPKSGAPDWLALAIVVALLFNALLTLIAGTRLWAHIFWRPGREGDLSELANLRLHRLDVGEHRVALGACVALVLVVAVLGIWPNMLLEAGQIAAADLMQRGRYVAAVGLEQRP